MRRRQVVPTTGTTTGGKSFVFETSLFCNQKSFLLSMMDWFQFKYEWFTSGQIWKIKLKFEKKLEYIENSIKVCAILS